MRTSEIKVSENRVSVRALRQALAELTPRAQCKQVSMNTSNEWYVYMLLCDQKIFTSEFRFVYVERYSNQKQQTYPLWHPRFWHAFVCCKLSSALRILSSCRVVRKGIPRSTACVINLASNFNMLLG